MMNISVNEEQTMELDKSKPVMVTGATGYVAGWLVKKLLDEGLTVHAPVRDPGNSEKLKHLEAVAEAAPGSIEYFEADLLKEGSYAEAMAGCQVVFHTASPFKLDVEDPQRELIEPALLGTRNVLEEVNRTPSVFPAMAETLLQKYGDAYPIPRKVMPKWLVWLAGPIINKAMTRKMVSRNVDHPWVGDASKSVRELDMSYRPLSKSMNDFFQQMVDSGQLKPSR